MINNRQGGRRRGRGGQRGQNLGGQPGNRQDNRQRGNAAQLLEKYKSLARDAQLAGHRVQTEYYLQYADHYFRVLNENRARFEDQRRQREDGLEEEGGDEELEAAEAEGSEERQSRDREDRQDRGERFTRHNRDRGERRRFDRDDRSGDSEGSERETAEMNGSGDDSLPLDVLPPAIGADGPAAPAAEEDVPAQPKRRARRPRSAEGDEDIAPAA